MKNLFIPNHKNKYTPHLLSKLALIFYVIVIVGFNILFASINTTTISADITTQDLLSAHNAERAKAGLAPLSLNTTLSESAKNKAEAMFAVDCWSHYCPSGKAPWDFFLEADYNYEFAGENLAEGFQNPDSVMQAWLNSPTHRENILSANFSEVGFAFVSGDYQGKNSNLLVVVHFGKQLVGAGVDTTIQKTENTAGSITIDNLSDGQVLDQQFIEVMGEIQPEDFNIDVYFNNEAVGRVKADGQNYTYRSDRNLSDGLYTIYSQIVSDVVNIESAKVVVRVDGGIPQLKPDTVIVYQLNDSEIVIEFETSEDVVEITTTNIIQELSEFELNQWRVVIDKNLIETEDKLRLSLVDFSENKSEFEINLRQALEEASILFSENNNEIARQSIPQKFVSRILNSEIQTFFPVMFVTFLIVLFLIDFIVLVKTDMIHKVGRKPHAQISLLFILLLTIVLGGVGGSILNGIQV